MLKRHRMGTFEKVFVGFFVVSILIDLFTIFNLFDYCKVGLNVCEYQLMEFITNNIIFGVFFILHNLIFIFICIKYISKQLTTDRYFFSIYGVLGILSLLIFWILLISFINTRVF